MIDELELTEPQAEAIIEKAIEFGVYTDDMPSSKKDKNAAAHEIVAFAIDSYVSDGVTPDSDDKETAEAGEQIVEIFELAGVEVDEDGEITYGDPPEAESGDDDDNSGDEAAIDIGDVIEGYEELTAATRIKKIKALELDPDDDDDYNTLVGIAEWEEAQDEPSSRVLNYLNEVLPEEVDGEAEPEGDDNSGDGEGEGDEEPYTEKELLDMDKDDLFEVADEFEIEKPKRLTDTGKKKLVAAILEAQEEDEAGEGEGEGDEGDGEGLEEPWDGYEDATVKDIKEVLNDDERTSEELAYIKEYEESREKPRKAILDLCDKRIEEIDGAGEPEPEPEPEKKATGRRRGRRGKTEDPDENDDVDNAVAKDDEKDAKKSSRKKAKAFVVTAELNGNEIEGTFDGVHTAIGYMRDLFESGAETISISKG